MKKIILSTVLCGGILMGMMNGLTVQAADTLSGNTEIGAEVIKGDVSLTIDATTDFGSQPLSETVDFGSKDINYTVTDYSGTTNGYEISAKLADADGKRSLKIGEVELSEEVVPVVTKDVNIVGENSDKVTSTLVYTNVTKVQKYTSTIEWNLTKGSSKQISE
ncbi:hypothetical protein WJ048_04025 [Listeria welshimeri]|uniref:Putative secreted protein n=1 Tax=Listeria welshimeri serovar 6b (strain ATCC 35897 / DSM 20650 / CCUG 15529 / CIP 8149 / NCTC 11857 / SLCC 5334 / V8) TaxID=386043 RepID=A0AGS5_LISW6|nr:hypothetical protein [Listeria welshimeri]CAK20207.1 putative secreted protein [Listeria welshimeri serovar 6b str. SLCC5334]SNV21265.1 Uncharacterised protein [Listeria welshimeri]